MTISRLVDLADLRPGVAFRAGLEPDPRGELTIVQAKDLPEGGAVDLAGAVKVAQERRLKPEQLLRAGDVLVQVRGGGFRASLVEAVDGSAVAASPVCLVRPRPGAIEPAYLAAFLNLPGTAATLLRRAQGSHVPQVPLEDLAELPVPVPAVERQRRLAELEELARRERALGEELAGKRLRLIEGLAKLHGDERGVRA